MGSYRPVSRVAIIGAGPSGLAAAKYLLAEKVFEKIDVFEQKNRVGGIWNVSTNEYSKRIPIPQTNPTYRASGYERSLEFESPLYEYLETNIPKQLMAYSDQAFDDGLPLFPGHKAVLDYLEQYADGIRDLIKFDVRIAKVRLDNPQAEANDRWSVTTQNVVSGEETTLIYDAVVVASGHYSVPYVPDVPGVAKWNDAYPGVIIHSKAYRKPEGFSNKKVLVVGNSASGSDIAAQISQHCKKPLLLSSRAENELFSQPRTVWREDVPELGEFLPPGEGPKAVKFKDGRIESNIEAIVFATGYLYSFPFLDLPSPVVTDGFRTHDTYQHLFHIEHPTLAFPVLNTKVIPFPLAENQAAVIARVWSGRLALPSQVKMRTWESDTLVKKGDRKAFHVLKHPEDAEVLNALYAWAESASKVEGLDNDGQGKLGLAWDREAIWLRSRFPDIKASFAKRGKARVEVKTLEDLGFVYSKRAEC